MTDELTYKDAGVDIDLGDKASEVLYNAAKETWKNRDGRTGQVFTPFDDFTGLRAIRIGALPEGTLANLGFDGVGTKMELGERIAKHDTIAYDLFAMVCDDAAVRGAEPVLVGSVLDVNTLTDHLDYVKQLAHGYIGAARDARVAVINGEIAELGARVSGHGNFNYNWSAGVLWLADEQRILTGEHIEPGQYIVSLRERGFRSNGLSLVRRILTAQLGENWHRTDKGEEYALRILHPSRIYSAAITDMTGGVDQEPQAHVSGIAHITGGGIPGKLGRTLKPTRYGAVLNTLFEPPRIMKEIQDRGKVAMDEAYRTWNMGNGMLVITNEPENVITIAKTHGIDAQVAGYTTPEPGITVIDYRGKQQKF